MAAQGTINVHSVETFGTNDGPGIRLVIFLQGCLFRCLYCHNPDTQKVNSDKAISLSASQIIAKLKKQEPYFGSKGGVTFSGGEPTVQAKELLPICKAIKKAGFHITLDSCGAIHTKTVNQLYDVIDLVLLDVKHIDENWHKKLTRASNTNVLANASYREQTGKDLWLRYVLVPGWTDQPEFLHQWGQHFSKYNSIKRVQLIPYHTLGVYKYQALGIDYALKNVKPPTKQQVSQAQNIFDQYFNHVTIH